MCVFAIQICGPRSRPVADSSSPRYIARFDALLLSRFASRIGNNCTRLCVRAAPRPYSSSKAIENVSAAQNIVSLAGISPMPLQLAHRTRASFFLSLLSEERCVKRELYLVNALCRCSFVGETKKKKKKNEGLAERQSRRNKLFSYSFLFFNYRDPIIIMNL